VAYFPSSKSTGHLPDKFLAVGDGDGRALVFIDPICYNRSFTTTTRQDK
jgi:hypothetical protein